MDILKFEECNVTYAKDQPEYLQLPAHRTDDGVVTSCWRLSLWERLQILFAGVVFLQVLTFNNPLQPLKMLANNPLHADSEKRSRFPKGAGSRTYKDRDRITLCYQDKNWREILFQLG